MYGDVNGVIAGVVNEEVEGSLCAWIYGRVTRDGLRLKGVLFYHFDFNIVNGEETVALEFGGTNADVIATVWNLFNISGDFRVLATVDGLGMELLSHRLAIWGRTCPKRETILTFGDGSSGEAVLHARYQIHGHEHPSFVALGKGIPVARMGNGLWSFSK